MKVHEVSVAMAKEVHRSVMPHVRGADREIADPLHRAACSVVLNIAEGHGVGRGKRQRNHFRIALGSARETMACIELAVALGLVDGDAVAAAVDRVDHVCAMLFELTRRAAA